MIRWALVVATLAVLTLFGVRELRRPIRESWMIVGGTGDGSVLLFRWSYGNTGVFADEVTTRLVVVPPGGRGLELRAVRGAGRVEEGSLVVGPERVVWRPGHVEAEVAGDNVQMRASLRGAEVGCPPKPSRMSGVVEFAPDGITLAGDGALIHTRSTRSRPHFALYVMTRTLALGIDPTADCPAWIRSGTTSWSGAAPEWEADDGQWRTTLGTAAVTVRPTGAGTVIAADEGQLAPEHWLAWLAGQAAPWEVVRRVMVSVDGGASMPGLLIESDPGLRPPDRVRPEAPFPGAPGGAEEDEPLPADGKQPPGVAPPRSGRISG